MQVDRGFVDPAVERGLSTIMHQVSNETYSACGIIELASMCRTKLWNRIPRCHRTDYSGLKYGYD